MVGRKSGVCVNQIPSRSQLVGGFVEISFSSTQNLVKSNHPSSQIQPAMLEHVAPLRSLSPAYSSPSLSDFWCFRSSV